MEQPDKRASADFQKNEARTNFNQVSEDWLGRGIKRRSYNPPNTNEGSSSINVDLFATIN